MRVYFDLYAPYFLKSTFKTLVFFQAKFQTYSVCIDFVIGLKLTIFGSIEVLGYISICMRQIFKEMHLGIFFFFLSS